MISLYFELNPQNFGYRPFWQIILRFISLQFQVITLNFLLSYVYGPLCWILYIILMASKTILQIKRKISYNLKQYIVIRTMLTTNDYEKLFMLARIEKNFIDSYSMYTRLIIFIEDYQKYFSKIFLIALIQTIMASQIIMNSLKFIQNDHHIVIMLYYFLFLDYVIIIILSFIVSIFNSFLNSIRYDLQRTVWLMNSSPSRFRSKFQMLMYYERLVKRSKPWGLKLGVITVMTTATFAKVSHYFLN